MSSVLDLGHISKRIEFIKELKEFMRTKLPNGCYNVKCQDCPFWRETIEGKTAEEELICDMLQDIANERP